MSLGLTALVLFAAILHAAWNALLKGGADRFRAMVVMSVASGAVSIPFLFVLPFPDKASWPAIAISATIHVAYNLFLVAAYRHGELGEVYPVARGASPLLVAVGALWLADERPHPLTLAGILFVSLGIMSLVRGWTGAHSRAGLLAALVTGCLIAAYTVTDGVGGRAAGAPDAYAAWLFAIDCLPMPLIYWAARRQGPPLLDRSFATLTAVAGGLVSLLAYAIVIHAASIAPMGVISALRETSVVFAALIGWAFLGEKLGARRVLACVMVTIGAVLIGYR